MLMPSILLRLISGLALKIRTNSAGDRSNENWVAQLRLFSVGIMLSLCLGILGVENSCEDYNYERVEEVLYRRKI